MPGNHKSARRSGARGQQASPLGRGFLTGLLTGAVLTSGVFVAERFGLLSFDPRVQGRPSPAADTSSTVKEQADKPHFEFYALLPEMEVVVETEAFEPRAGKRSESVEAPPLAGAHVLQAGSFKGYAEADALKVSLALLGLADETIAINRRAVELAQEARDNVASRRVAIADNHRAGQDTLNDPLTVSKFETRAT